MVQWNPNFRKGVDLPTWDWLANFPQGLSYHGSGIAYDGKRYIFYVIQYGNAITAASGLAQLWRFDTWTEGWQFLAQLPGASWAGADLEYDPIRNCLYSMNGNAVTWQVFNLNTAAITVCNVACPPWALTAMTPALPVLAGTSSSFTMPDDQSVPTTIDTAAIATGGASTSTSLVQDPAYGTYRGFGPGMVGLQVRFTSGALVGQRANITAVPNPTTITLATALTAAPAAADIFVVELPTGVTSAGSTTTAVIATGAGWPVNMYGSSDVVFTSGALLGQRRRIASNTIDTLTLAAAYTGGALNARVGPLTAAPAAGDTFRIVPSSDFLYYQNGGTANLYRIDLGQTGLAPAWALLGTLPAVTGGGANTLYAQHYDPFSIICIRGAGTNTVWRYGIGPNSTTALANFGLETLNTGSSSCLLHGKRRLFVTKEGTTRSYMLDLTTGIAEPGPTIPYAVPGAYDGKRSRFIRTDDGVEWLYHLRAGGQETFRLPLEWPL